MYLFYNIICVFIFHYYFVCRHSAFATVKILRYSNFYRVVSVSESDLVDSWWYRRAGRKLGRIKIFFEPKI